jgi:hypothetical protein
MTVISKQELRNIQSQLNSRVSYVNTLLANSTPLEGLARRKWVDPDLMTDIQSTKFEMKLAITDVESILKELKTLLK